MEVRALPCPDRQEALGQCRDPPIAVTQPARALSRQEVVPLRAAAAYRRGCDEPRLDEAAPLETLVAGVQRPSRGALPVSASISSRSSTP